jgi:hypothetical protein
MGPIPRPNRAAERLQANTAKELGVPTREAGQKYTILAHGTTYPGSTTLVVPKNLRIVFFYDPHVAQHVVYASGCHMTNVCMKAEGTKQWVLSEGSHEILNFALEFDEPPEVPDEQYDAGYYKCVPGSEPIYKKWRLEGLIPLEDVIGMFIRDIGGLTTMTTLYIAACNTRETTRATNERDVRLSQLQGGRRKTRRSKRTKRRGTRHARVR